MVKQDALVAKSQDARVVKQDALVVKSQALTSGPVVKDVSGGRMVIGDANMASKKKKKKQKKGKLDPPRPRGGMGTFPTKLIPDRATAIDAMVAEVNSTSPHIARANSRRLLARCPS